MNAGRASKLPKINEAIKEGKENTQTDNKKKKVAPPARSSKKYFKNKFSLYLNDYLNLREEASLKYLIETMGDVMGKTRIFSETISRINSKQIRKRRILIGTDTFLHIVVKNKNGSFKVKKTLKMKSMIEITLPKNNSTLVKFKLKNE